MIIKSKKQKGIKNVFLILCFGIGILISLLFYWQIQLHNETIKVGILHSQTGTMKISEKPVIDATLLAIEEINSQGGVLGRKIEPVVVDGKSDIDEFARAAEKLITQDKVLTVFGCWTSACRKTVKPIFEEYDNLLIYPVQYEGLEQSPNIVYTGAAPNQQIIPAVKWAFDNIGQRFFLVGSDYVFPRTANEIIKDQVIGLQGEIVGEEYLILGSEKVEDIVDRIAATQPDVILNTINGSSNVAFFKALREAGITPEKIPTISFSIAEEELRSMKILDMVGDYAAWNYFQSIETPENQNFVAKFKQKYGQERVTNDPIEAGYFGVYLWAQAVEKAGTFNLNTIQENIKDRSFDAPEGVVYLDPETQHTWKYVRIGKIRNDGQFEIVWSSGKPIRPVPYPISRSKAEWEDFLNNLYLSWNKKWANEVK
ncbi:MAG: urea ABC transporter substrate-binding protein [Prochloraceae cyanobacterium]|nr:urea ABC transporter substrate-binding protein [Prochloraceae cyanobacterium]